jgi:hypothetical protein
LSAGRWSPARSTRGATPRTAGTLGRETCDGHSCLDRNAKSSLFQKEYIFYFIFKIILNKIKIYSKNNFNFWIILFCNKIILFKI